jgi:hypothetical protein
MTPSKNIPHKPSVNARGSKKYTKNGSFGKFRSIFIHFTNAHHVNKKRRKILSFSNFFWESERKRFLRDENGNCSDDSITQNENECNLYHHSTPPLRASLYLCTMHQNVMFMMSSCIFYVLY